MNFLGGPNRPALSGCASQRRSQVYGIDALYAAVPTSKNSQEMHSNQRWTMPGRDSSRAWRTMLTLSCLRQATARAVRGGAGLAIIIRHDEGCLQVFFMNDSLRMHGLRRCAHEACGTESPASVCQAFRRIPFFTEADWSAHRSLSV